MTADAFRVLEILTGYQGAAMVAAAARLGIFDALGDAPRSPAEVATELGVAPRPLAALLAALAELDIVSSSESGFRATETSRRLGSSGDLGLVVRKEAFFATVWNDLDRVVRAGAPLLDPWRERVAHDPSTAREFLAALVTLARVAGPDLTALPQLATPARVLDIGGGLGSYAVPLAAAGHLVTLVELPGVADWARQELEDTTVTVVAADAVAPDEFGANPHDSVALVDLIGADVVLLSHIIHDLADEDASALVATAARLLRPGGTVVVLEYPGDESGFFGPTFDLMMQLETAGRARTASEIRALLANRGFGGFERTTTTGPTMLLTAVRP